MTDHHERDDVELASAYLDGVATADERARVEGDAELLALVARMRRVRTAVAENAPAPAPGRERAIAAALREFDQSQRGSMVGTPTPPANVVPLDRRRRLRALQGLTAAAAAALIVVGGFVIAGRGDDEDSSIARDAEPITTATATAETAETAAVATTTSMPAVLEAVTTGAAITSTTGSTPAGDEATAEVAAQLEAPAAAPATAASPATTVPIAADAELSAAAPPPAFGDADELRTLAESLAVAPPEIDAVVSDCRRGVQHSEVTALFEDADGARIAVVVVATDEGYAAVSIDDCSVVLRAPT